MANFDALNEQVARLEGIVPSVVAVLNGVADAIDAAVAANDAGDNAQLATLADSVRAQADALAAAVATEPTP